MGDSNVFSKLDTPNILYAIKQRMLITLIDSARLKE